MEVDSYLQDRLVHEYWTKPVENWLEYFMSYERFEELLKIGADKELLAKLATQFAEQACNCEQEERALQSKDFPPEDVHYYQRKGACLWLCSLACFSAIQWDFYYLLENYDFLTVRPIVERVKKIFNDTNLTSDATFGNWLWDKFCLTVALSNMIPAPYPKPTVQNPLVKSSPDLPQLRFEANQKAILEVQLIVTTIIKHLEEQAKEGSAIYVPGYRCFFDPFKEGASKALNIGILGEDVLVSGPPVPRLSQQVELISADDVSNKAKSDLVFYYFNDDSMLQFAAGLLKQIKKGGDHPLIYVDMEEVEGYRVAFGFVPIRPEIVHPDDIFNDDAPHRVTATARERQRNEAVDPTTIEMIELANATTDLVDQQPKIIRQYIDNSSARFLDFLQRRMTKIQSDVEKRRVYALLHYFCATIYGFRTEFEKHGFPKEWSRGMVLPPARAPVVPPVKSVIQTLVNGNPQIPNHFWTIITSFNVDEIGRSLEILLKPPNAFSLPRKFRFSEVLQDFVGAPNRTIIELNAILIGKAFQLAQLQNISEWTRFCNQLPTILSNLQNSERVVTNIFIEAMHVANCYYNDRIHIPWHFLDQGKFNQHVATVKRIFTVQSLAFPTVTNETLAFCLNTKDFEFVVNLGQTVQHNILTGAKLLAAFGTRQGSIEGMGEFLTAWYNLFRPILEKPHGRGRNDPQTNRQVERDRTAFISFIGLIKESSLVLFLISFFAHVFNSVIVLDKKPHLKLFVQQSAFFPSDLEITNPHLETITELLSVVIKTGLEVNPCNAFWLRTSADFQYVQGNIEDAATLYMESLLTCSPTCQAPFPENVIDDVLWCRLRVCLNRMGQHTMAALCCQLLKQKKSEEYAKVAQILSNQISLDAGSECLHMLFDLQLAEILSEVYDLNKQLNNGARLQSWAAKPSLNPSNRQEIINREQSRRCEQLIRTLAAYLFETHL